MAAYMEEESDFHPKNTKTKGKRHRVTAPQYGIVNIEGLRDDYPHVSREQTPPPWWTVNLENMYRCQMAGYRDEKHYLQKRRLKTVQKWQENGLIKKLIRWDGLSYYFSNHKECPDLKADDMKKAFLREPVIFENTAYLDKSLVWAPIITEQAQRFNEACDEIMRTIRKPKKSKKGKNEAGPSKTKRNQEEKTVTFANKDKHLLPEEGVLSEKKKSKEKNLEKRKTSKENKKKSAKNKSSTGQYANGDGNTPKMLTAKKGKENITENEPGVQNKTYLNKLSDKKEIRSAKLPTIEEDHLKNCGKSLSTSDFSRSESQIGKEYKKLPKRKKSSIKPSTSAVLKKTKQDSKSPAIPVSARVAAKKSSQEGLQKIPS